MTSPSLASKLPLESIQSILRYCYHDFKQEVSIVYDPDYDEIEDVDKTQKIADLQLTFRGGKLNMWILLSKTKLDNKIHLGMLGNSLESFQLLLEKFIRKEENWFGPIPIRIRKNRYDEVDLYFWTINGHMWINFDSGPDFEKGFAMTISIDNPIEFITKITSDIIGLFPDS